MKNIIKVSFIYTLIFITILSPNIFSNENKWKVEIELDKQTYVLYEPIWLDVNLYNRTSETLRTQG